MKLELFKWDTVVVVTETNRHLFTITMLENLRVAAPHAKVEMKDLSGPHGETIVVSTTPKKDGWIFECGGQHVTLRQADLFSTIENNLYVPLPTA